jgi:16S rRNA (adenine1518-N6/adenine1519-N6)-dimethyltransferase
VAVPAVDGFFRVVKAGFSQKRKQLRNSLAGGLQLEHAQADALLAAAGIDPQRRAETMTLSEWAAVATAWDAFVTPAQ